VTEKKPANQTAGMVSVVMAVAGALLLIAPLVMPKPPVPALPLMVIELIWWGATLVFGIIGRRSLPGKIGLIITLTVFSLVLIVLVWLVAQHSVAHVAPVSAPTVPSLPSR
jgi:hypothetical protein